MKHIIDIPDDVKWIQYIQQTCPGTRNLIVEYVCDMTPYTEPDQVEVKNNDIHLCESCRYDYPDCPSISQDTLFGDGNDNICCCNKYEPYTKPSYKAMKLQQSNDILKVARMNYYKGAEDGWNLAREIAYCMSLQECEDAGMVSEDDIYDDAAGVLEKLNYQEAKTRYDAWRADKAQKESSELEEVTALADKIGIHRLYVLVKEIRGE